jgi:Protein of unknown function (DUF2637)
MVPQMPAHRPLVSPQVPPRWPVVTVGGAMTSSDADARHRTGAGRDWWVVAGMAIAAASAAVASFSGLRGIALIAGWPDRLAWLLPLTVDAYAMTSARVWLATSAHSAAARRFARANALGAIAASIAGNAAYHAVGAGLLTVSWPIVVVVGAVPAAVLGLTAHLHARRGRPEAPRSPRGRTESGAQACTRDSRDGSPRRAATAPGKRGARRPTARRRPRTESELLAAAREADERYRAARGRAITRDALRAQLRVSGARASDLRRRLAAERETAGQEGGGER